MSYDQEDRVFGDIEFSGKDIAIPAVPLNKLAMSGRGELLLISVISEGMRLKAIRAVLCGGAKAIGSASGIRVGQPDQEEWRKSTPGRVTPTPEGYQCYTHTLGFNLIHAMFVTRKPGFMRVVTEESLWQELNDVRFTTPVLREWMPFIEKELRKEYQLENANTFNCRCGILTATTNSLDKIVTSGLKSNKLTIPCPAIAL